MSERQPILGVLLLETRFRRIPGDIGNPETFSFPVIYHVVAGADVERVVLRGGDEGLVPLFVEAGEVLQERGADLIAASCGFLSRFQGEIARALRVPFLSSSLLQLPWLCRVFGHDSPVGIVTASESSLGEAHFKGVGAEGIPVRIAGMDTCDHFRGAILTEEIPLNPARLRGEVLNVARGLVDRDPEISALVLECTNLSPYRNDIRDAVGRPVFDIVTLIESCLLGFTR